VSRPEPGVDLTAEQQALRDAVRGLLAREQQRAPVAAAPDPRPASPGPAPHSPGPRPASPGPAPHSRGPRPASPGPARIAAALIDH